MGLRQVAPAPSMRMENLDFHVPLGASGPRLPQLVKALQEHVGAGAYPLRVSIAGIDDRGANVEATVLHYDPAGPHAEDLAGWELLHPCRKTRQASQFCAVQIVPTGIRCELGGYAGDAGPATNLLASAVDVLVTHPNAVNASELNEMTANTLYVEGKSLDDFLLGRVALLPSKGNCIGTVFDPTGGEYMDSVMQVLNAGRCVAGIDCSRYTVLDEELGVRIGWSANGCAVGTVERINALLAGVERILNAGCDAIGIVSVIHGSTRELFRSHLEGRAPNPSGGVEAIITHLISKLFRVPTAHSPLPYYQELKGHGNENPRASAEFISTPHYFSVLKGLSRAPRLMAVGRPDEAPHDALTLNHVGAIVAPATALGGIPALAAEYSNIPLIAVRDNHTILNVTNKKLGLAPVVEVDSYAEAAGVLLALGNGITLDSIRRPIRGPERVV